MIWTHFTVEASVVRRSGVWIPEPELSLWGEWVLRVLPLPPTVQKHIPSGQLSKSLVLIYNKRYEWFTVKELTSFFSFLLFGIEKRIMCEVCVFLWVNCIWFQFTTKHPTIHRSRRFFPLVQSGGCRKASALGGRWNFPARLNAHNVSKAHSEDKSVGDFIHLSSFIKLDRWDPIKVKKYIYKYMGEKWFASSYFGVLFLVFICRLDYSLRTSVSLMTTGDMFLPQERTRCGAKIARHSEHATSGPIFNQIHQGRRNGTEKKLRKVQQVETLTPSTCLSVCRMDASSSRSSSRPCPWRPAGLSMRSWDVSRGSSSHFFTFKCWFRIDIVTVMLEIYGFLKTI